MPQAWSASAPFTHLQAIWGCVSLRDAEHTSDGSSFAGMAAGDQACTTCGWAIECKSPLFSHCGWRHRLRNPRSAWEAAHRTSAKSLVVNRRMGRKGARCCRKPAAPPVAGKSSLPPLHWFLRDLVSPQSIGFAVVFVDAREAF